MQKIFIIEKIQKYRKCPALPVKTRAPKKQSKGLVGYTLGLIHFTGPVAPNSEPDDFMWVYWEGEHRKLNSEHSNLNINLNSTYLLNFAQHITNVMFYLLSNA